MKELLEEEQRNQKDVAEVGGGVMGRLGGVCVCIPVGAVFLPSWAAAAVQLRTCVRPLL